MLEQLIKLLVDESGSELPLGLFNLNPEEQFRALCNVRPPVPASEALLKIQDSYLQQQTKAREVVDVESFIFNEGIALWQGDITRLNANAIVNACNSALLGCFHPLHNCIDNNIHTNAGIQVRLDCQNLMNGDHLPNGDVKVTSAYNLPSRFIFHTVGPIVQNHVPQKRNQEDLKACYVNCLEKAAEMGLNTIAFCCLSTGVYGYPKKDAAELAIKTVRNELTRYPGLKVIFNVFTDEDNAYYEQRLSN